MKKPLIALLIVCLNIVSYSQDRITGHDFAGRSEIISMNGMAATSQPLATQVALDILKKAEMLLMLPLRPTRYSDWLNQRAAGLAGICLP